MRTYPSTLRRIASRTITDERGCWIFTGSRQHGYGYITHEGRWVRCHRFVYEALVAPIPDGLVLDHLCRNRACVNPAHLEPVTVRMNTLRGDAVTALNARKTHCANGHPFDDVNTGYRPGGWRFCRACAFQSRSAA